MAMNNGGDTIDLIDPTGKLIQSVTYKGTQEGSLSSLLTSGMEHLPFSFEHTLNGKRERITGLTLHQAQWAKRIYATGKLYLLSEGRSERDRGRHIMRQAETYVVRIALPNQEF
jgi:hypothetical protein